MSKSEMFKKAHQMTREVKAQFPKVNYRVQFGLSLAYLHNVEEEAKMVELKGTVKQVKWAEKIRERFVAESKKRFEMKMNLYKKMNKPELIEKHTNIYNFMMEKVNNENRSVWFIEIIGNSDRDYNYIFDNLARLEKQARL